MTVNRHGLKGGFVDIIEGKFYKLEAAIKTMHGHLEEQHLVDKPQEKHLVNNAFKYVDDKISQVPESVKKFEKCDGAVAATFGGNGGAFTSKMREDMFHMHAKLVSVDAEVSKTFSDASVPIYEQLNILHLQAQAQQEQEPEEEQEVIEKVKIHLNLILQPPQVLLIQPYQQQAVIQ